MSLKIRLSTVAALWFISSCSRDLTVPQPPPPPGPGTIQGTLVYLPPGRSSASPAVGATVELLASSVSTTVTESNGHFTLEPINRADGLVLIRYDANEDGVVDHQRVLHLDEIQAGPGRDVALGEIVLGGNATVQGSVLLRDRLAATSGLSGTTIFVPEGPFIGYSGDNGSFILDTLPEGLVTLTFFREGYISASAQVELRANQLFAMNKIVLERSGSSSAVSRVSGQVALAGSDDASGVTVTASGSATGVQTDKDGRYSFPELEIGLHSFGFEKSGYKTVTLTNVLVEGAETTVPLVTLVTGTTTVPNLDAGYMVPDGGGNVDGGGTNDGGPVAVVGALPSFVPLNSMVTLNGESSTGTRPLVYHWTQDAGPTVTVPNNHTVIAATPKVTMPGTTSVLKMALTVTDALGVSSAPTEFTVVVAGAAPTAVISPLPPTPAYAGQRFTVGSTGSNDGANGSGIVDWEWTVLPANSQVTAVPQAQGSQLELTMPSNVPASTLISVQLVVTDGLGIKSAPVSASFTLSNQTAPTWTLDAGALQIVAGGAVATLSASASAPGPGATFSMQWSPASVLDAGTGNWQLLDPTAATTQFIAPVISGANQNLDFTVTATNTSGGLMPAQRSAMTTVLVQDQRAPQVIATSVSPSLVGSPMGAWVDFDEDLSASYLPMSITSLGAPAPPPMRTPDLVGPRRVRIVFDGFAPQGAPVRLATGAERDLSPYQGGNSAVSQNINYTASFGWPAPATSASSSTEPHPAVVLVAQPLGAAGAYLVGRKESAGVIHQLMELSSCDAGCTVSEDLGAPVVAMTASSKRVGPRTVVAQGLPYVALATADYSGVAGVAIVHKPAGWATIASPPGTLFTDGTTLYSAFIQTGSVKVSSYDPVLNSWGNTTTAGTSAAEYTSVPGSLAQAWGWAPASGAIYLLARTAAGDLRTFQRLTAASAWTASNLSLNSGADAAKDLRIVAPAPPNDGTMSALILRQSGVIEAFAWGSGGVGQYATAPSAAQAFDAFCDQNLQWLATIESGQVMLRLRNGNTFTTVPGPPRPGPANSLNNDVSCVADSPAVARSGEHVVLAWQEKCGAGPWKMHLRYVR